MNTRTIGHAYYRKVPAHLLTRNFLRRLEKQILELGINVYGQVQAKLVHDTSNHYECSQIYSDPGLDLEYMVSSREDIHLHTYLLFEEGVPQPLRQRLHITGPTFNTDGPAFDRIPRGSFVYILYAAFGINFPCVHLKTMPRTKTNFNFLLDLRCLAKFETVHLLIKSNVIYNVPLFEDHNRLRCLRKFRHFNIRSIDTKRINTKLSCLFGYKIKK